MFIINNITTRRRSGNVIVNFEDILPFPAVSIVDFKEVMLAGDHLSFRGRYLIK